ncbi:MAG: alpha-galactosidase [Phycisphaerae bacterium]|nr:alpha-galactosidase [Phycisphaerae bacterium]
MKQIKPVVRCIESDVPVVRYNNGLTMYEEGLIQGRWVVRNWSTVGIVDYDPLEYGPLEHNAAFGLELDGQTLHRGWRYIGMEEIPTNDDSKKQVVVKLEHQERPVKVGVHTLLDGTAILTRWLEIENCRDKPIVMSKVWVWSGRVFPIQSGHKGWYGLPVFLTTHSPYSMGYYVQNKGFLEGDFQWRRIEGETLEIGQDVGRSGWGHPIAYFRDEASGQIFVVQLAWSGNWAIRAIPRVDERTMVRPDPPFLFLQAGPRSPGPMRVIDPKETLKTPTVHFGCMHGDLTDMVQVLHEHQRRSVIPAPPAGKENLVSFNHSGHDIELNSTEENMRKQIDVAAEIGADIFTVDACWNGRVGQHWGLTTGDWHTQDRLPNGLEPVFDYARSKGLLCGLWCWIEAGHQESNLIKAHPDWLIERDGTTLNNQLDLAKPQVAKWVEQEIARLVERYQLDLFRIDYNESPGEGGYNLRHGFPENNLWRYYESWYGILERIAKRFPGLIIENCAGGGGRTDLGMMSRTHYTWISDYNVMPRSARTLSTMMYALAPELTVRLMGTAMDAHLGGSLDLQIRVAFLSGNPCVVGLWTDKEDMYPELRERIRHAIELYRKHFRPMIRTCRVYHHTPIISGNQPEGWCVVEYGASDKNKVVAGLFRLAGRAEEDYVLRLRGVDRSRQYRVLWDNSGETSVHSGAELLERGIVVRLASPMSSELVIAEATA